MAAFHGKGGSVTFNTVATLNVISWTVEATADMAEITSMGDTWKTVLPGFQTWTATVECNLEDAGPDPDVTTDLADANGAALKLSTGLTDSNQVDYYTGTAIVTGVSASIDKGDVAKVTYAFQGSGVLAEHEVP